MGLLIVDPNKSAKQAQKEALAEIQKDRVPLRIGFSIPICKVCTEHKKKEAEKYGLHPQFFFMEHPDGILADEIKMERDHQHDTYTLIVRCHGTTHEKTFRENDIIDKSADEFFDDFKMLTNRRGAHHRFQT